MNLKERFLYKKGLKDQMTPRIRRRDMEEYKIDRDAAGSRKLRMDYVVNNRPSHQSGTRRVK